MNRPSVPRPGLAVLAATLFIPCAVFAQNGLDWSTYLGGSSFDGTRALSLADNGDVLLAGSTDSINFPATAGAFQTAHGGGSGNGLGDAFLARLDPRQTGQNQLQWATYLGGSGRDVISTVTTDASGGVTVCGVTTSPVFPTTSGCLQANRQGASDGFVARFDAMGGLVWCTLFGGSGDDNVADVVVHPWGVLVVTGASSSADLPTTSGVFQPAPQGGFDGYVAILDGSGSRVLACTYLGGSSDDFSLASRTQPPFHIYYPALELGLDRAGNPVVAGSSDSNDYPTTANAYQTTFGGGVTDGVVTCLDLSLSNATYTSYLGGSSYDYLSGLDLTASDQLVVTGSTRSTNFPTTVGAFDTTYNGHAGCNPFYGDVFVTILDPSVAPASQLVWSTYYGSPACDSVGSVSADRGGTVTVYGTIILDPSGNAPTTPGAYQRARQGQWDVLVARFDPAQTGSAQLRYATYLGGSALDGSRVHKPDGLGNAVITGVSTSVNFPTTPGAFQPALRGFFDAFAARLSLLPQGVARYGATTAACGWPIFQDVNSWPQQGNTNFKLYVNGAPPQAPGVILLGSRNSPGYPVLNAQVLVGPAWLISLLVQADTRGSASFPQPLPLGYAGMQFSTQWLFLTDAACPGSGNIAASEGLEVTIQQ